MKKITLPLFLLCSTLSFAQGVGINTTSTPANPSAMLDVDNANRGVLLSRVSLTATNVAAPITAPANSLLVFNLASAGAGATAVSPGFYYWNAPTSEWIKIIATNGSVGNDNQDLTSATLTGNNLTIAIQNGAPVTVDLSSLADADSNPTNEMNTAFSVVGTNLVLTDGGGTFTLPITSIINAVNAYNTTLTVSGGNLNLTDGGGTLSVPLSSIATGSNSYNSAFNVVGTDLNITDGGGTLSVPLTAIATASNSYNSALTVSGGNLNITDGGGTLSTPLSQINANDWKVDGNAGTTPATNFLGTTDNQDLVFRTNNTEKARVTANGYVGVGTSTPISILDVFGGGGGTININTNGRIQTGDGVGFGGVWLNGGTYDAFVGNFGPSFGFYTPVQANALQINKITGNVGIGTQTPSAKLSIIGGTQAAGKVLVSDASGIASWGNTGLTPPGALTQWSDDLPPSTIYPNNTAQVVGPFSVTTTGWYTMYSRWYVEQNTGGGGSGDDGEGYYWIEITDNPSPIMGAGNLTYETRIAVTSQACTPGSGAFLYLIGGQNYYIRTFSRFCKSAASTGERRFNLRFVQ
jgi:hypothetical protein